MHRRGDDPPQPQGDGAGDDRGRHVPFPDFFPEVEGDESGRDRERREEYRGAEGGEEKSVEERDIGQIINVNISEASGVGLAVGRQPSKLI